MFTALQRNRAITFRTLKIKWTTPKSPFSVLPYVHRSLLHVVKMSHEEGRDSRIYLALHFYFTHKQIEVLNHNHLSLWVDGRARSGIHAEYSSPGSLLLCHQIPKSSPLSVKHPFCPFYLFYNFSWNDAYWQVSRLMILECRSTFECDMYILV